MPEHGSPNPDRENNDELFARIDRFIRGQDTQPDAGSFYADAVWKVAQEFYRRFGSTVGKPERVAFPHLRKAVELMLSWSGVSDATEDQILRMVCFQAAALSLTLGVAEARPSDTDAPNDSTADARRSSRDPPDP